MIQFAIAMACGNAVSLLLKPESGSAQWRLLRRKDGAFAGYDDVDAVLVSAADNDNDFSVVDYSDLTNGQDYHYRHYCLLDGEWVASGDDAVLAPAYVGEPLYSAPDVTSFVRERVQLGMNAELGAGRLSHDLGRIPVLAANPTVESVTLPVVTVILELRKAEVRGIGETLVPCEFDGEQWTVTEGWMDRSNVQVAVWARNHEDRLRLRDALQRVLMLNLPVFDAAGLLEIDISEHENFDFETYDAPVYQSVFDFSCLHAALVAHQVPPITDVEITTDATARAEQ